MNSLDCGLTFGNLGEFFGTLKNSLHSDRPWNHYLDADVVRPPRHPAGDRAPELLTEAPAHGAVDEEVERIAEQDDQVEEQVDQGAGVLLDQRRVGGVLDDHDAHRDAERKFDEQEHRHNHDKHQRCRVTLLLHTEQARRARPRS